MTVEILRFHPDMLTAAGELLAQRHRKHRATLPAFPVRFEDPAVAYAAVQAAWQLNCLNRLRIPIKVGLNW